MGLSTNVVSIVTWMFLPSFLSSFVLSAFYRVFPTRRPRLPANPTPATISKENDRARQHARNARITLLGAYLLWITLGTYLEQERGSGVNYYRLLGVSRDLIEQQGADGGAAAVVKSRWRKLARVYHPDKVGKEGEAFFVELKRAVDVLEHDGRRWAYERFGPGITQWGEKLVTQREFVTRGIQRNIGYYIVALLSIAALSFFRPREGTLNFWRYLTLALTLCTELSFVLRPTPSPLFGLLLPHRLPFEHIEIIRQLSLAASIAMSQLIPLLQSGQSPVMSEFNSQEKAAALALADAEALKPLLQRLSALTAEYNSECESAQLREMIPFLRLRDVMLQDGPDVDGRRARFEKQMFNETKERMVKCFEDMKLKTSPDTREIWQNAVVNAARRVSPQPTTPGVPRAAPTPKVNVTGQPQQTPVKAAPLVKLPQDIPLPPSPPPESERRFPDATRLQSPPPEN